MPTRRSINLSKLLLCCGAVLVWLSSSSFSHGWQIQETFQRMLTQRLEASWQSDAAADQEPANLLPVLQTDLELEPMVGVDGAVTHAGPSSSTLEQFETTAIANHPRLMQLQLEITALRAESVQQSLPPNPQVGVFGDELFNEGQSGLYGAFLSETIVPHEKLRTRAQVKCREADAIAAQIAIVQQQVRTDVRTAFYQVLIAQRQNELATQLAESYKHAIDKMEALFKGGEVTRSDILQVEVQYQQALTGQTDANATFMAAWRQLASITGDTSLMPGKVEGNLDLLANQLDFNLVLADLVERSPELQLAVSQIRQAEAVLIRERSAVLRNTQTQWTVGRDSATEDVFAGFQVSVPWQKYNRNQGNIAAAEARLQSAHLESELLARQLANRLAVEFRSYEAARNRALIYVNEVLPKSQEALSMVNRAFEGGEAGFLELLTSQRTLIESTNQYLAALLNLWISRQKIEGLLLSGSLDGNNG